MLLMILRTHGKRRQGHQGPPVERGQPNHRRASRRRSHWCRILCYPMISGRAAPSRNQRRYRSQSNSCGIGVARQQPRCFPSMASPSGRRWATDATDLTQARSRRYRLVGRGADHGCKKLQKAPKYDQWTLSRVQRVTSLAPTPCLGFKSSSKYSCVVDGYDDDDGTARAGAREKTGDGRTENGRRKDST